jgi:hypothetical protein
MLFAAWRTSWMARLRSWMAMKVIRVIGEYQTAQLVVG